MKKLLLMLLLLVLTIVWLVSGCNARTGVEKCESDSVDVYLPLQPNVARNPGCQTYGADSVSGHTISYRLATDSSRIYADFEVTVLDLHPEITESLLSFIHHELLEWRFIDEADTIVPLDVCELTASGLSQNEIVRKFFDWESGAYYRTLPSFIDWDVYYIEMKIYPVFMNDDYVTFMNYAYYDTGGAHGNHTAFLQTYSRKTGGSVDLEDMIKPDKIDKVRERVVMHMASSYPIYSSVTTVEEYLDSLNSWMGYITEPMGVRNPEDSERITLNNYPLNGPGIHGAGLVFTYGKYQLTPGCDGCPVVVLTYDEIRDCLKEPFNNYCADISEFERYKRDTCKLDTAYLYSEAQLDSVRFTRGLAPDGHPWPRDISDWYKYRHGPITRHYRLCDITGAWCGRDCQTGHSRQILTLHPNGYFSAETEMPVGREAAGEMRYYLKETVRGKYTYDPVLNKLVLKNWNVLELRDATLETYIRQRDPENRHMVIHRIDRDTMYIADETGNLLPYCRQLTKS